MNLTPEQKAIGKENFYTAMGLTRREFLAGTVAAGGIAGAGLGAMYFGYDKESVKEPVRVGWIGTGDEGSVLIGAHNPEYIQIKAIADIRPFNIHRAFHGDQSSKNATAVRPGLLTKYGWKTEKEAREHVKVYEDGWESILDDPDIEAVVIALPLHLHAPVAIKAMQKGKHVLTEKLMGHTVHECKEMGRVAEQTGKVLAVGHQRHYSVLYDNAVHAIKNGLLGDLHHIRAQWHRNNRPGVDSWSPPLPGDKKLAEAVAKLSKQLETASSKEREGLAKKLAQLQMQSEEKVDAAKHGYESHERGGRKIEPIEELIRWRIWNRTGGGLMAELGSHQLDASGIFCSAAWNAVHNKDGDPRKDVKVYPLSVTAVGGRHIFAEDRGDCDDHVYCTYEYPAPGYDQDKNKKIVVTYSSIEGSDFGGYGEVVMGTKRTLILEREADVLLYENSAGPSTKIAVGAGKDGAPTLDTTQSGGGQTAAVGKAALEGEGKPVSRGYTEELEHWAWCIRNPSPENKPRCHPKVALADAVIALTSTMAMTDPARRNRIEFKPEWFDINSDETPEGVKPDITRYKA